MIKLTIRLQAVVLWSCEASHRVKVRQLSCVQFYFVSISLGHDKITYMLFGIPVNLKQLLIYLQLTHDDQYIWPNKLCVQHVFAV